MQALDRMRAYLLFEVFKETVLLIDARLAFKDSPYIIVDSQGEALMASSFVISDREKESVQQKT